MCSLPQWRAWRGTTSVPTAKLTSSIPPTAVTSWNAKAVRTEVVVAVKTHQRQRVRRRRQDPPRFESLDRDGQHRGLVGGETFDLVVRLAPHPPMQVRGARRGEVLVQLREGPELAVERDQEVPTPVADQVLDHTLLVAAPHPTEMVGEQELRLEAQELSRQVPLPRPDHLGHRDRGVVIGGALRDPTEELERFDAPSTSTRRRTSAQTSISVCTLLPVPPRGRFADSRSGSLQTTSRSTRDAQAPPFSTGVHTRPPRPRTRPPQPDPPPNTRI